MTAAIQAHIAEHFAFKYREQIEQQLGAPLPYFKEDDEEHISQDVEVQISRAVAQAAQQLTMQNMAQAQQKEAQQKTRLENQQALNKWKQTLATQETTYQKLDSRYRQAVRDAEKKEREKR
jgi:hypothetical protein